MVVLTEAVLGQYRCFSLYNSPYSMHEHGCAIDLYPHGETAMSPVAGRVVSTRTVAAPASRTGARHDHVIVIETPEHLVRILHVNPRVETGEDIELGDGLGRVIDSGFFAPWVDPHLHVGFRPVGSDPYRARGSLPVTVDVEIDSVPWAGTGVVRGRGETYAILDAPGHPAPGTGFAGIGNGEYVIDGGFPHYPAGGVLGRPGRAVSVAGERVGTVTDRRVAWDDVAVRVNHEPITGISFAVHRDRLGVKLVSWDGLPVAVGDEVTVSVARNQTEPG